MSGEQRDVNAVEPQSKRQKLSGVGEIIAFGGPMYDDATARKILKEVVLVKAADALDGEAVLGFDPDDAALNNTYYSFGDHFEGYVCNSNDLLCQKGRRENVPLPRIKRCFNNKEPV